MLLESHTILGFAGEEHPKFGTPIYYSGTSVSYVFFTTFRKRFMVEHNLEATFLAARLSPWQL